MEGKYQFLKQHVIKTSDNLITNISKKVAATRNEIIKKHRTAVLLSMVDSEFDKFPSFSQNKKFLEKFVIDPEECISPWISPHLVQQSSHLLAFLHSKNAELLECMIAVKDQEEFHTLVHSSIPSCFGFFCVA